MKVIQESRIRFETEKINFYIANDGRRFNTEEDCDAYERALDELKTVKRCEAAEGMTPYDGSECSDEHEYKWYFVSSEKDAKILSVVYGDNGSDTCGKPFTDYIGQWICVEIDDDNAWISPLSKTVEHFHALFEALGEPAPEPHI